MRISVFMISIDYTIAYESAPVNGSKGSKLIYSKYQNNTRCWTTMITKSVYNYCNQIDTGEMFLRFSLD